MTASERPAPVRREVVALVALVASLAVILAGCTRDKVDGEGRLDPSGRVLLVRDDQPETVTRPLSLQTGDTVEVTEGDAKITLPGGDVLELRPRSILVLSAGPDLRTGNMLVITSGPQRTVRAAGNQVDALGTTRIDASLALRVVAYGGKAVVRSGGRTLEVQALREASVPVIGVLRGPRPLAIDRNDAWDQRLLGDAATKEADVESRARGFTGQVAPANARSLAYYRSLLPGLENEPFQQADVDRLGRVAVNVDQSDGGRFRAGDVLLGAAVAMQGRRGTFAERLAGGTAFRAEGASWTLVALDQQVPSMDGLLRLVDGAVNVAPLELAAPGSPAAAAAVAEPPPARAGGTASRPPTTRATTSRQATPTTRPAARQAGPSTSTPLPLPPQQQQPPQQTRPPIVLPLDPLLDTTVDPVLSLLNDLLGNGR